MKILYLLTGVHQSYNLPYNLFRCRRAHLGMIKPAFLPYMPEPK